MTGRRPQPHPPDAGAAGVGSLVFRTLALLLALQGGVCLRPPLPLSAQVEAEPTLRGRVLRNGEPVDTGTVTLHRVTPDTAGELHSTRLGPDGGFSFRLPAVPDPGGRGDVYFASTRYRGILYFGTAVNRAVQLDSIYRIQVYDTTAAPPGGGSFPVAVRNLFLEQIEDEGPWRVVDLIQISNPGDRTVVAAEGEPVWSYPLPEGASDFQVGEGDISPGSVTFEEGGVVVEAPIPPGERTYLFRYRLPELEFTLPLPGTTERLELLVREPAPPLSVPGLSRAETVELEPGSSYRRYAAADLEGRVVEVSRGSSAGSVDIRWIAVGLALVLAVAGILAVRRGRTGPAPLGPEKGAHGAPMPASERERILLRIAELDDEFEEIESPSEAERERYRDERGRLLARLHELD